MKHVYELSGFGLIRTTGDGTQYHVSDDKRVSVTLNDPSIVGKHAEAFHSNMKIVVTIEPGPEAVLAPRT